MKIGLCGTMSVGKTTLVNALAELPEFKDYKFRTERSKHLMELGIPLNTDSTLEGQIVFMAERASELLKENILTDRSVVDVMAFTEASKSMKRKEKNVVLMLGEQLLPKYDHLFYIPHDGIKIEHNGVRETNPEYRDTIDFQIRQIIKQNKDALKNVHILQGSTEERIELIKQVISS